MFVARRSFQDNKLPADHAKARAELDRAIKAADATYYAEVGRLAQEQGVTIKVSGSGRTLLSELEEADGSDGQRNRCGLQTYYANNSREPLPICRHEESQNEWYLQGG
jgi:hypothetical protein